METFVCTGITFERGHDGTHAVSGLLAKTPRFCMRVCQRFACAHAYYGAEKREGACGVCDFGLGGLEKRGSGRRREGEMVNTDISFMFCQISGLIPGGPAAESSLLFDGDRLLAVDSVVTDSLLVDQVILQPA